MLHIDFSGVKKGARDDAADKQAQHPRAASPTASAVPAATPEKEATVGVTKYAYEAATAPSRGNLIKDFLIGSEDAAQFMEKTQKEAERFNGFSLLLFEFHNGLSCSFLNNVERQAQFF